MRLDLLRHGDTGRSGYLDGRTDVPLTETGLSQTEQQAASGDWSIIIASPLKRAREPAERLAHRLSCSLRIDADWAELDFGRWDGRRREEIESRTSDSQLLRAYYDDPYTHSPPDGESWRDFEARVRRAILCAYTEAEGRRALVVTHAGPMRVALSTILGIPLKALWSIRIAYATRIGIEVERSDDGNFWGELVDLTQP